jgi:hypothetical protein
MCPITPRSPEPIVISRLLELRSVAERIHMSVPEFHA